MQHTTSPPQQFCLRWNNYQTNLTSVFDQLLQSESFVDVTLACDGHSVKAHKMVLSACSPYFQSLFFDNPCQHPIVIMRDIKWPELKAAVEFMYKGEINVSQEQIGPLLKVAETLKIRGLADVNGEQDLSAGPPVDIPKATACAPPSMRPPREWEATTRADLSEDGMSPSLMVSTHRLKKRRRLSGERSSSMSSPADSLVAEPHEATPADLSPAPPPTPVPRQQTPQPPSQQQASPQQQQQQQQNQSQQREGGSAQPAVSQQSPMPPVQTNNIGGGPDQGMPTMSLPLPPPPPPMPHVPAMTHLTSHPADDMEIKPGIAEMIREEERAKLLESSHAWLGASTSSIADSYQYQLQSMWQKCWNTNQSLVHNLRFRERGPLKSWRPETMAEAIFSVLKEGLSLSQAARKYDIPYPTFVLYANRVHNMLGPSADGGADLRPKGRGRPQRILLGVWPDEHIRGVIRAVVFRDSHHHIKEEAHLAGAYPRLHDGLSVQSYPSSSCSNGPEPTVSPSSAAAAAVAAVAQGLRQQMCSMVAAAQHHPGAHHDPISLVNSLSLSGLMPGARSPTDSAHDLRISPATSAHDLDSPLSSPLTIEPALNLNISNNVEVGIGVSGMTYKPPRSYSSPRPENLFQEDIEELVKSPLQLTSPRVSISEPKDLPIKMESMAECRGE